MSVLAQVRQRLSSAVRVSASQSLGSRFKIPPGSRFFDLFKNRCQCSVDRSLPWIWYLWFVNWEKGFVSVFTWFRNNSIRHGCTAVMLNGVPLPTTVFEKVVKCWGYTLVRRMGTLNGGPGSRTGGEITPLPRYLLNTPRKEKA